jgi:1-deoxy-D-xylulose-5-phosphate synthase
MAYEGLINAGQLKSDLIVVLNDNGQFIDAPTGSLHHHLDRIRTGSMYQHLRQRFLETLKKLPAGPQIEKLAEQLELAAHKAITPGYIFEDLGFRYFGPVDGHDLAKTEEALLNVARLRGPILLHVMTKKGGGWEPAAADPLKYHGPKGFDVSSGIFKPKPAARTYSTVFADTLAGLAAADDRVVAITAAMPSGTALRQFAQRFPERMFDVGICEQHSFAFAQGLAIAGMRPFLAHYSTFAQRGYDQLFQEICLSRDLGVVITLDRAGMVGEDGETHQGLYDIAWARCLPGLVLMAPRDGDGLAAMLRWSHQHRLGDGRAAGYCIRYPKDEVPQADWGAPAAPIELGRAEVLRRGDGPLMVWAYGASVLACHLALAQLGEAARGVTLVDARFAKPFDADLLAALAVEHPIVLTVEDHALPGRCRPRPAPAHPPRRGARRTGRARQPRAAARRARPRSRGHRQAHQGDPRHRHPGDPLHPHRLNGSAPGRPARGAWRQRRLWITRNVAFHTEERRQRSTYARVMAIIEITFRVISGHPCNSRRLRFLRSSV